jgi:hypothetical protein
MDLRTYYRKIREAEALLDGEYIVVVSLATSEGGREGVLTEAPRAIAAKLVAEGRARVASEEETAEFRESIRAARRRVEEEEAARRVQVMVIPPQDLRKQKERS